MLGLACAGGPGPGRLRIVRLVDRRYTKYYGSLVGERAYVDGRVRRLDNDTVDGMRTSSAKGQDLGTASPLKLRVLGSWPATGQVGS